VGGDWYDVIPLEGGAVGLVMGDVEGHDLDAAALMGLCRSAVRAYALEGHPPSLVAARANILLAGLELGRMVTMSYTHLQPLERLVTVVSAGHPGTQVVAPDGEIFEIPSVTGPPLGVFESGLLWPETTSTLPGHALFAMFTDGLTEVRGEDIDVGLARVRHCLFTHRHEEPDTLAQALLATRGSSHDDVAILAARLTENAQPGNNLTRRLPPTPHSVSLARRSSRQLLLGWGIDEELVAPIELVVSELASNAVRHTEHPIEIRLSRTEATVRIEVEDDSYRLPPFDPKDQRFERLEDVATGGRGLVLVRAFASRWGTQPQGLTKYMWAEFDLEPAEK
jgi:anti-sigma regulatory factor (Ser/Thr protein kinase)